MTDHLYFKAKNAAGRAAISLADEHGADAAVLIRGAAAGFIEAAAMFDGWDALLAHIHQLAAAHRVPAEVSKPGLKIVQGGKA